MFPVLNLNLLLILFSIISPLEQYYIWFLEWWVSVSMGDVIWLLEISSFSPEVVRSALGVLWYLVVSSALSVLRFIAIAADGVFSPYLMKSSIPHCY
jgi:hypothetical protein